MITSPEQIRLLAKICQMYYMQDMTQQQIADATGLSRSKVSRSLSLAREEGIVKISIVDDYSEEQQCENELRRRFRLDDAAVVAVSHGDQTEIDRQMAEAITSIMEASLKNNDTIGVMAGYSITGISKHIGYIKREGLRVVTLVGGLGSSGAQWQPDESARNFAQRLRCSYLKFNAPACVVSQETHDALVEEPEIKEVLNIAASSAMALVGIGNIFGSSTVLRTNALRTCDLEELRRKNAIASICGSYLNAEGRCVDASVANRMIGINIEDLKRIPKVIAIANGQQKVAAIIAALRSGVINVLATDLDTAKAILACTK